MCEKAKQLEPYLHNHGCFSQSQICHPPPRPTLLPTPQDGAYVYGLFMEGARWDDANTTVDKARPKEMFIVMPCMCVRGITLDKVESRGYYKTPC